MADPATILAPLAIWLAVAVGFIVLCAALVPALRRPRRRLVTAATILAVVCFASAAVGLLSAVPTLQLAATFLSVATLGALLLPTLYTLVWAVIRIVDLCRALYQLRRGLRILLAGDAEAAEPIFREAARRGVGTLGLERLALLNLGMALTRLGRYDEARAVFEGGLALPLMSRNVRSLLHYNLASTAFLQQDFAAASEHNRQAQAAGASRREVKLLPLLLDGRLAARTGDFERAKVCFSLAAESAAATGSAERVAQVEVQRGILDYLRGDHAAGRERILAALPALTTKAGRHLAALCLAGLSALATDGDGALFLARATELEGRDLSGEAQRASAYLKA